MVACKRCFMRSRHLLQRSHSSILVSDTPYIRIGGVVAYPVMQAYDSLALEDNGEAVLGRCSISCVCTSAFKLPAKEADPQLAMGPFFGRGAAQLVIFIYLFISPITAISITNSGPLLRWHEKDKGLAVSMITFSFVFASCC